MKNQAFTIVEILITVSIIALIVTASLVVMNPMAQVGKAWDGKRKSEMDTFRKVMEDFYNDKGRFPIATELCYDAASTPRVDSFGNTACYCHVCGRHAGSPSTLNSYMPQLLCDPQSPKYDFLYDFDCVANPRWYRLYTSLYNRKDPVSKTLGCERECGPSIITPGYNYLVYSGALAEAASCTSSPRLYQLDQNGWCNICKSPTSEDICNYSEPIYLDNACNNEFICN